jgi:hypothetical protein
LSVGVDETTAVGQLVQQSESPETVDLSRRERLALVGPASKRYQDFHSVPLDLSAGLGSSILDFTAEKYSRNVYVPKTAG